MRRFQSCILLQEILLLNQREIWDLVLFGCLKFLKRDENDLILYKYSSHNFCWLNAKKNNFIDSFLFVISLWGAYHQRKSQQRLQKIIQPSLHTTNKLNQ